MKGLVGLAGGWYERACMAGWYNRSGMEELDEKI